MFDKEDAARFLAEQHTEEARQFLGWADFRWAGWPARGAERLAEWQKADRELAWKASARAIEVVERYVERGCVVCGKLPHTGRHGFVVPRGDEAPAAHFCDDCEVKTLELLVSRWPERAISREAS
jgi:hypothetical protein